MTDPTTFTVSADRLLTPDQVLTPGWVRVGGGRIEALGAGRPTAPAQTLAAGCALVPGFVDMHVHGAGGGDLTAPDPAGIARARAHLLYRGVTSTVASLVTAPVEQLEESLGIVADLAGRPAPGLARLLGTHLEGPFLAVDRRGMHDLASLRTPDVAVAGRLLAAGRGTVRMMTLAPELPGAEELLRLLRAEGVVAAMGHTDATYERTRAALDGGITVGTHLYNAMRAPHHREPGPAVTLLDDRRATVELINDGVHIHPAVARVAVRAAHEGRLALVSDGAAATGAPDGRYTMGPVPIRSHDGRVETADGRALAAGMCTLDGSVRRAVVDLGMDLAAAVSAATTVPARALGVEREAGSLADGRRADLCVLDADLHVAGVMLDGVWAVQPPL